MSKPGLRFRHEYARSAQMQNTSMPDMRGQFAIEFAKHYGMITGTLDGEDSQGRSRMRLLTPAEVVERAVAVADRLFDAIDANGWLHDVPENIPAPKDEG